MAFLTRMSGAAMLLLSAASPAWAQTPEPAATPVLPDPPLDCANTIACVAYGQCTAANGQCIATDDATCERAQICASGFCSAREGRCVVADDGDCAAAPICRDWGLCSLRERRCQALTPGDCAASRVCREGGRCFAFRGQCVPGPDSYADDRSPAALYTGATISGLGFSAMIAATALFAVDDGENAFAGLWTMVAGGTALAIGIPMWAAGDHDMPRNLEPESEGAMIGGLVMSGLGISGIAGGAFALPITREPIVAVPLAISGGLLAGGIALTMYGIASVPVGPTAQIGVSPTGATAVVAF